MKDQPARSLVLRNVRIVLPERTSEAANVLIEDGRIVRIFDSSSEKAAKADSLIDLDGLTLFPGFIDVHIHGAVGVDAMEASADDLCRVSEFLASAGVTAWLPTLVPAPQAQYESAIRAINDLMGQQDWERGRPARTTSAPDLPSKDRNSLNANELQAGRLRSQLFGVHYEGPFVNSEQCGALHRDHFRTFKGLTDVDALPTINHESAIHMMTLAPEIDGGIELIKELKKRNWIVSIGHTCATTEVLDEALAAGAHHMTHFMNAMTPLHHRAPGPVDWGLLRDEVTCDVIADGVHIDPAILKLIFRNKSSERISLISDAIAAAGLGDGDYEIWGEKISVNNGRTKNARGSIAGSVITMLDAARLMLTLGITEPDVARMASLNPARLLGIDHDYGSLEEGKRADLVVLDEKLNVRLTIIGGQRAVEGTR